MEAFVCAIMFFATIIGAKEFAQEPNRKTFAFALVSGWAFIFLFITILASRIPG